MHAFIFAGFTARVLKARLRDSPLRPELTHLVSVLCKNSTHRRY